MTPLHVEYDAIAEVWFAYDGDTRENSRALGQGNTPEDARADFWNQVNGSAADLYYSGPLKGWCLEQDGWFRCFESKKDAIAYADAHEWQAKSL